MRYLKQHFIKNTSKIGALAKSDFFYYLLAKIKELISFQRIQTDFYIWRQNTLFPKKNILTQNILISNRAKRKELTFTELTEF